MLNMQQECECRVHVVKLLWVRRSRKFGGAKAEQEWNLASLLGSERFLLAFCQTVEHSFKSYIMLLLVSYMKECCNGNVKIDSCPYRQCWKYSSTEYYNLKIPYYLEKSQSIVSH